MLLTPPALRGTPWLLRRVSRRLERKGGKGRTSGRGNVGDAGHRHHCRVTTGTTGVTGVDFHLRYRSSDIAAPSGKENLKM